MIIDMNQDEFRAISKRKFIKGEKITVSIRLPEELKNVLEGLAEGAGRSFSDFIQEGLDQWATINQGHQKRKS